MHPIYKCWAFKHDWKQVNIRFGDPDDITDECVCCGQRSTYASGFASPPERPSFSEARSNAREVKSKTQK